MRALHYGALALIAALAVGGCSRQPPLQAAAPCVDLAGAPCAVGPDVIRPGPSLSGREAGSHRHKSVAAARHKRAHHHVAERPKGTARQPQVADATPARSSPAAAPSVQEQVAVAAALAERITALSALPAPNSKPEAAAAKENSTAAPVASHLVAVVMVRPSVHAVSDLRGHIVAIDERYATAHNKVAAGMAVAGASDVQLMQGQGTAINRLTNGEVSAAVVAVVMPEAADAFPEIAGYKTFRVPLPTM